MRRSRDGLDSISIRSASPLSSNGPDATPTCNGPGTVFPLICTARRGIIISMVVKSNFPSIAAPSRECGRRRMRLTRYFQPRAARFDAIQMPRNSLDCWHHDHGKFDRIEFLVALQRFPGPTQETPVLVGHRIVQRRVVCPPIHTIRSARVSWEQKDCPMTSWQQ